MTSSLLIVLLLATTPAAPQAAPGPAQSAEDEKVICRSIPVLGWRTKRERRCMTRAEWTKLAEGQQKNWKDTVNRTPTNHCVSGC